MTKYITIDVCTDIDVPVYEIIEQISDKDLIDEILKRGRAVRSGVKIVPVEEYKKGNFKRLLCDILSLGYQVSDDEVIRKIKENL